MTRRRRDPSHADEPAGRCGAAQVVQQLSAFSRHSVLDPSLGTLAKLFTDQTSGWRRVQEQLGMQMCLFAFVEPTGGWTESRPARPQHRLHYLSDQDQFEWPPYLVPWSGKRWQDDKSEDLKRHALHAIRQRELERVGEYPLFVRALQRGMGESTATPFQAMLSAQEQEQHVLFAPCGEISFFCLGWLLRRLLPSATMQHLRSLREGASMPEQLAHQQFLVASLTEEELAAEAACGALAFSEKYPIRRCRSITEVLEWLGLQRGDGAPTRRLWLLLSWLRQVGEDVLGANSERHSKTSATLLARPDDAFRRRITKLKSIEGRLAACFSSSEVSHDTGNRGDHGPDLSIAIGQVVALAVADDMDADAFKALCRFSPEAHIILRAYEGFERSWLVVPVLAEHIPPPTFGTHTAMAVAPPIGFALGTICNPSPIGATGSFWLPDRLDQVGSLRAVCQAMGDIIARAFYWPDVYGQFVRERELGIQLASIVHDLKTQAYAALLCAQRAETAAGHVVPSGHASLQDLSRARETLDSLYQDMGDLLHGIAANDPTPEPTDFEDLVTRVARRLCTQTGTSHDRIAIASGGGQVNIPRSVARTLEGQILRELLRNALQVLPDGSDIVRVTTSIHDETWTVTIFNRARRPNSDSEHSTKAGLWLVGALCENLRIAFDATPREVSSGLFEWESVLHGKCIR